jgi:RNA polymerase primary sigma factor
VGDKFGVTRERIRQLQNIALNKMRRSLNKLEKMNTEGMAHAA